MTDPKLRCALLSLLLAGCSGADAEPAPGSATATARASSTAAASTATTAAPSAAPAPAAKPGLLGLDEATAKTRTASIGYEAEDVKSEILMDALPLLRFDGKSVAGRFSVDLWDFGSPPAETSAGLGPKLGVAVKGPKEPARKKLVDEILASGCQADATCLAAIRKAGGTGATGRSGSAPIGPQKSSRLFYMPDVDGEGYQVHVIAFGETAEGKNLAFHSIVEGQRVAIIDMIAPPDDKQRILDAIVGK